MKGKGIQRSTDAGKTWEKVSDLAAVGPRGPHPEGRRLLAEQGRTAGQQGQGRDVGRQGTAVDASIGPLVRSEGREASGAAGPKGIIETTDGGETWKPVAPLPEKFSMPKAGWFTNVAWDPGARHLLRLADGEGHVQAGDREVRKVAGGPRELPPEDGLPRGAAAGYLLSVWRCRLSLFQR